MNASRAFAALVATASGVAALVVLLSRHLSASVEVEELVVLCGSLIGSVNIADATADTRITILAALMATMALAGIGAFGFTIWRTRVFVRTLTRVAAAVPEDLVPMVDQLGLTGRIVVSQSPALFSFCYGFMRPRICVSEGLIGELSADELRAVLAHERYHLRRRDPFRIAVANVLAAMSFPIPLTVALRRVYVVAREIDADREAMHAVGRKALAGAVYKVLVNPRTLRLNGAVAVGAINGHQARIDHLVDPHKPHYPTVGMKALTASAAAAAAIMVLTLAPWNPAGQAAAREMHVAQHLPGVPVMCDSLWSECRADGCAADCAVDPSLGPCPHEAHRLSVVAADGPVPGPPP